MDVKIALQEFGLSEKECSVYLTLLPLGCVSFQEVSARVDLPKSTIYNTINYLQQRGLVTKIIKEGVAHFEAVDPSKLLSMIDQKRILLQNALPELEILKKMPLQSSSVQIFEGNRGLFTLMSEVFSNQDEVCYYGGYALSVEVLKHQPEHFRTIRMEKNISARIVIEPSAEDIFATAEYKKLTQMRFLESMRDFPAMVFVKKDLVAMFTLKGDLIGVLIKNSQIAQAMQMTFEMYWSVAQAVD